VPPHRRTTSLARARAPPTTSLSSATTSDSPTRPLDPAPLLHRCRSVRVQRALLVMRRRLVPGDEQLPRRPGRDQIGRQHRVVVADQLRYHYGPNRNAVAFVRSEQRHKLTPYELGSTNCVEWAETIARAAGRTMPPTKDLLGIASPGSSATPCKGGVGEHARRGKGVEEPDRRHHSQ
jgi:hypothetical protein